MWIISGLGAFALAVLLMALAVRLPGFGRPVILFVFIGGFVGVLFAWLGLRLYGLDPIVGSSLLVYAFPCELYIFLFTLASSSVSVRVLAELAKQPLHSDSIAAYYQTDAMVERRLAQLRTSGLINNNSDTIALTSRGRLLVWAFKRLRVILGMATHFRE